MTASLKERSTCGELGFFLGVEDGDDFEKEVLVDEATGDGFALFWKAAAGPEVEAFLLQLNILRIQHGLGSRVMNMISCAIIVSVSTSCSRCYSLVSFLCFITCLHCIQQTVTSCWTYIYIA